MVPARGRPWGQASALLAPKPTCRPREGEPGVRTGCLCVSESGPEACGTVMVTDVASLLW